MNGLGDQLEAFSWTVDVKAFRPDLDQTLAYSDGSKGGRPPFDPVLMFNILVIQTLNNPSDERTEYLINDRLSFMCFLSLGLLDRVPVAKILWLFRERLTQAGAINGLFDRFDMVLRNAGYLPMSGQILDATLVAALKQRKTNAEKAHLREGRISQKRQDDGTMPSSDLAIPFFGYKSHISTDRKFRFIRKWKTTHAAANDGARLREGLLNKTNTASTVWAEPSRLPSMRSIDGIMAEGDTAYRSKDHENFMEKQGFVSKVHRKKPHLKPMPRHIQRSNAGKSVVRSRVEHGLPTRNHRPDYSSEP